MEFEAHLVCSQSPDWGGGSDQRCRGERKACIVNLLIGITLKTGTELATINVMEFEAHLMYSMDQIGAREASKIC